MKLTTLLLLISLGNCLAQKTDSTQVLKTLKKGTWKSTTEDPYYSSIYTQNINYNFKKNGKVVIKFIEDSVPIKINGSFELYSNSSDTITLYIYGTYNEGTDIGDEYKITSINRTTIKLTSIRAKGVKTYQTTLNKKRLVTRK